jgi:hypothetical protein
MFKLWYIKPVPPPVFAVLYKSALRSIFIAGVSKSSSELMSIIEIAPDEGVVIY